MNSLSAILQSLSSNLVNFATPSVGAPTAPYSEAIPLNDLSHSACRRGPSYATETKSILLHPRHPEPTFETDITDAFRHACPRDTGAQPPNGTLPEAVSMVTTRTFRRIVETVPGRLESPARTAGCSTPPETSLVRRVHGSASREPTLFDRVGRHAIRGLREQRRYLLRLSPVVRIPGSGEYVHSALVRLSSRYTVCSHGAEWAPLTLYTGSRDGPGCTDTHGDAGSGTGGTLAGRCCSRGWFRSTLRQAIGDAQRSGVTSFTVPIALGPPGVHYPGLQTNATVHLTEQVLTLRPRDRVATDGWVYDLVVRPSPSSSSAATPGRTGSTDASRLELTYLIGPRPCLEESDITTQVPAPYHPRPLAAREAVTHRTTASAITSAITTSRPAITPAITTSRPAITTSRPAINTSRRAIKWSASVERRQPEPGSDTRTPTNTNTKSSTPSFATRRKGHLMNEYPPGIGVERRVVLRKCDTSIARVMFGRAPREEVLAVEWVRACEGCIADEEKNERRNLTHEERARQEAEQDTQQATQRGAQTSSTARRPSNTPQQKPAHDCEQ